MNYEFVIHNRNCPCPSTGRDAHLNRRYSIRDKARFRKVRQQGASHPHPLVVLCYLPNGESFSRCGFTVSRRIGGAVERNRDDAG